jgi:hypothetical protein
LIIVVLVAAITSVLTIWLMTVYFFPKEFKPVELSASETKVLNAKVDKLTVPQRTLPNTQGEKTERQPNRNGSAPALQPERYTEAGANRTISFTERELNALLARNTDLGHRLAIDLSENLASAKLLVPMDPEIPILGGKTLKVSAGLELRYAQRKPVVILKGISLWGVPIPNAWLGGIKNIDLVKAFNSEGGFWQTFAAGVDEIRVEEGRLTINLKE